MLDEGCLSSHILVLNTASPQVYLVRREEGS